MWPWLLKRFEKRRPDADRLLELERKLAAQALQLEERDRLVGTLQADLVRHRQMESTRVSTGISAALTPLLEEVATPVVQLMTQAHLLEVENKPLHVKDVLAVTRRLVTALENHGLALEGQIGSLENYDPTRHEPLAGPPPRPGQPVKIRLVGVRFQERFLRRMTVELIGDPDAR